MKIVILDGYTVSSEDLSWDSLGDLAELTYYPRTAPQDIVGRIGSAEIVLTSKCLIDAAVLDACPSLKYIGVIATGYNNIEVAAARARGIAVTNIPEYSTASVAQQVFALLLEITNQTAKQSESVRAGDWQNSADFSYTAAPISDLCGKTLGIVGYGSIGKRVAEISQAFGLNVIVHTPHPPKTLENAAGSGGTFVSLDELLEKSNIITFHCPLTPDTDKLVNKTSIQKMQDGVILINTARGGLIDEADLAEALRTGKVAAAGLDVLSREAPRDGNPLIGIENCIITPHIAWATPDSRVRIIDIAYKNIAAFLSGEKLNRID
ncbi:MAG: D-2-hydroxyacid dehydrogenase [Clostridiales Family XIII bacterium]|jgi:glycerate dehydrogenase|nr:D-2-hydroxyacid dehydrogenase [Clostridiales Family XIII bacterium]